MFNLVGFNTNKAPEFKKPETTGSIASTSSVFTPSSAPAAAPSSGSFSATA